MRYLRAHPRASMLKTLYRRAQRDRVDFATPGSEHPSPNDVTTNVLGQPLYFPARVAEKIVVTNLRRDVNMTNAHDATSRAAETDATWRRGSGPERTETFSPTGPLRVKIATKSGDIRVRAIEGNELEVTLHASSSKFEHLLDSAVVRFDAANNRLEIESQPGVFSGSLRGLRRSAKSWLDIGGSDLDVFVVLPQYSSLDVKTMSGDTSMHGTFHDVAVASASGDVETLDSCRTLDVMTASGDVSSAIVLDLLKCRSASGDVRCRSAASSVNITSASGDVDLSAARPGDVVVKVVSGDVHVGVARGLVVDVNANTVSGDLSTNIDLNATGDATSDEDVLFIKVSSVSGDIGVDKAS